MTDHDQKAIEALEKIIEGLQPYHTGTAAIMILDGIRAGKVPVLVHAGSLPLIRDEMTAMQEEMNALRAELTEARRIFAEYHAYIQIEEGRARDAGITFSEVRKALAEYSDEEVSFSRLVEVMRRSAKVLSEDDIREKQSEVDHFRHCYETGVEVARQLKADNERLRQLLRLLWSDADKYEQPEDSTRQWCPEMMCYLRGGVGYQSVISKEDRARIEQELGQ